MTSSPRPAGTASCLSWVTHIGVRPQFPPVPVFRLVLTTEGGKPALKVTHRTLGNGFKLMSMDLRAFGGSRSVSAPDTTLPLDAARFAAIRRGLVGSGVEFGIAMSRSESYAAPFGGELGRIEAAMFDACVKARSAQ